MSKRSDEELQEELRHIYYEAWMLFSTGSYILDAMEEESLSDKSSSEEEDSPAYSAFTHTSPPTQVSILKMPRAISVVSHNSKVESFAIHTRALLEFFFPECYKPHDTDFLATHFYASAEEWQQVRGLKWNQELADIRLRVGREIAHITSFRMAYPVKEKAWPVRKILREVASLLKKFLAPVPDTLKPQDWSLDEEIGQILEAA